MLNATNYVNYKFENITFISRFHGLDIIELTPSRSLLANKPSPLKNEKKKIKIQARDKTFSSSFVGLEYMRHNFMKEGNVTFP